MFDMGFLELMLIGIIALIVLGPERLPKAARSVGLWVGKAKHGFESLKSEIDRELKVKELQEQLAAQKAELESSSGLSDLKNELSDTANTIHSQTNDLKESLSSASQALLDDVPVENSDVRENRQPAKTSLDKHAVSDNQSSQSDQSV